MLKLTPKQIEKVATEIIAAVKEGETNWIVGRMNETSVDKHLTLSGFDCCAVDCGSAVAIESMVDMRVQH